MYYRTEVVQNDSQLGTKNFSTTISAGIKRFRANPRRKGGDCQIVLTTWIHPESKTTNNQLPALSFTKQTKKK